ncbi:PREDICTED: cell growth regulator with RING finger domain protein 1-like isoform X1 [Nicrophorus vespilloides]|uniref:Cell growth regulator with RING finger domain protein 1-like isoform X1 n=1 Tax=Nicrophorus vespilloides TaxID=110193 RepID=A0ABM1NBH1_NICVS|nr:PREDICTED: cell growth regulator with RING finger domain protein 1-like isoform X1 [Nicrophorus vespilloides]
MTMSTMSVSLTELSNIFTVIAVILCFCAMLLYITRYAWHFYRNMMVLRVNGDDMVFHHGSLHQVTARIPQMNMMKVHIPFTFKLLETSKSTYSELQYSVSSQVRYRMHVYWGVNIKELHVCLWRPWAALKELCQNGTLLNDHYQQPGPQLHKGPHSDEIIKLSLPAPLDLGTPPRLCYPVVIFLLRVDNEGDVHPDETVALINVVHIKDSVCTLPTSILAQYLKQANGQLSCLKQLYLATGNPGNYDEDNHIPLALAEPVNGDATMGQTIVCPTSDDSAIWNSSGEQLCVVCQYFPLSRALLPCRHTCICASCFDKLDRCPMCRGSIKSYFCIRGEEYMPPIQSMPKNPQEQHGHLYNWLDSLNDALIDFLGFQR